jgi:hypothetical protein
MVKIKWRIEHRHVNRHKAKKKMNEASIILKKQKQKEVSIQDGVWLHMKGVLKSV